MDEFGAGSASFVCASIDGDVGACGVSAVAECGVVGSGHGAALLSCASSNTRVPSSLCDRFHELARNAGVPVVEVMERAAKLGVSEERLHQAEIAGDIESFYGRSAAKVVSSEIAGDSEGVAQPPEHIAEIVGVHLASAVELVNEGRLGIAVTDGREDVGEFVGDGEMDAASGLGDDGHFARFLVVVLRSEARGRAAAECEIGTQQQPAAEIHGRGVEDQVTLCFGDNDVAGRRERHAGDVLGEVGRSGVFEIAKQLAHG